MIAVNKEHGYPKLFVATWFKNSNALIIDIAKKLKEGNMSRGITLSVQSMNADTLEAIKRQKTASVRARLCLVTKESCLWDDR